MNVQSMTGFGRGKAHAGGVEAEVEVVSVNRRQFDAHINLPREAVALEPRIRTQLSAAVQRGRITVSVRLTPSAAAVRASVQVNEDLARAGIERVRASARRLGLADDLSASWLLRVPGWVVIEPPGGDVEAVWPAVDVALRKAIRALVRMRKTEGKALGVELAERIEGLRVRAARIEKRAPRVPVRYRQRLESALKDLDAASVTQGGRLEREVALMAERSDIREELTRLSSHLSQASTLLRRAAPCGRTLDFLAQEMGREINTIGAKAGDAVIASDVVAFKSELEQLREQVQNIE